MDKRKLSTEQVLYSGILDKEPPEDIAPNNIEWEEISLDFDGIPNDERCKEILLSGKGIDGNGYYGLPRVWQEGDGKYAVDCLQYRNRTFEKHGLTLDEAIYDFTYVAEECVG